jgi:chromate transporter
MELRSPTFAEATRVWARVGLLSFGGPAGQIALMHRMLVEERRWLGEQRFLHALNYCMLLPGPEAQQLAVYVGWLLHRTWGGIVAGVLFVVPGGLVMLALSIGYALFGATPAATGLFLGVKAAVLAVVIEALIRISRRALKNRIMLTVAGAAFVAIFAGHVPFPVIVFTAAAIGWLGSRWRPEMFAVGGGHAAAKDAPAVGVVDAMFERGELAHTRPSRGRALRVLAVWLPLWLGPLVVLSLVLGPASAWTRLAGFFSTMGVVTFGGAYAVLAYVAQAAVSGFGWLTAGEMADGLGLAETTPGPLILVLQFVGFLAGYRNAAGIDPLLAGTLAALLTTWIIFAPSFLWIFLGGPYVEALRGRRDLAAALSAITAAVVGVILNLAVWFALHTLFGQLRPLWPGGPEAPVWTSIQWPPAILAAVAMIAMLRFKVGMLPTLAACAAAGLLWTLAT